MSDQNQSQGQTKKCPKCGEEILSSAKVCKHCKADLRNWFARHKILTGILILIVISIIASIGNSDKTNNSSDTNTKTADESATQPVPVVKSAPEIIVTSAVIAKEYSENEVSADAKYKGKIIEVSGKITNVDNGITDNEMIVKLSDGEYDFNGSMCYMKESEKEKVLAFKKGQQITLIGQGNSATLGSPMLKDCFVK